MNIDHLVMGVANLDEGLRWIENLLGVRPVVGGRHPRWGTRNALVSLGPTTYLEIMAPDPELEPPQRGRLFRVEELRTPRMVTWVLRTEEIRRLASKAEEAGLGLGPIEGGSRERPDGTLLEWQLTDPYALPLGGALPFLISWGKSPHPALTAPEGGVLVRMGMSHPEPERVRGSFRVLGSLGNTPVDVEFGSTFQLWAELRTLTGDVVVLR